MKNILDRMAECLEGIMAICLSMLSVAVFLIAVAFLLRTLQGR